ncbi:hypothetical protein TRVL_07247 [Trypanosoma vivax]|nr:hypothetical protein TRVL_07247 [Trypanosoma vivax]
MLALPIFCYGNSNICIRGDKFDIGDYKRCLTSVCYLVENLNGVPGSVDTVQEQTLKNSVITTKISEYIEQIRNIIISSSTDDAKRSTTAVLNKIRKTARDLQKISSTVETAVSEVSDASNDIKRSVNVAKTALQHQLTNIVKSSCYSEKSSTVSEHDSELQCTEGNTILLGCKNTIANVEESSLKMAYKRFNTSTRHFYHRGQKNPTPEQVWEKQLQQTLEGMKKLNNALVVSEAYTQAALKLMRDTQKAASEVGVNLTEPEDVQAKVNKSGARLLTFLLLPVIPYVMASAVW